MLRSSFDYYNVKKDLLGLFWIKILVQIVPNSFPKKPASEKNKTSKSRDKNI